MNLVRLASLPLTLVGATLLADRLGAQGRKLNLPMPLGNVAGDVTTFVLGPDGAPVRAIPRASGKAVLDPKQIADAAHRRATEAFRALNLARPPSKRPKPRAARVEESVFAPSPPQRDLSCDRRLTASELSTAPALPSPARSGPLSFSRARRPPHESASLRPRVIRAAPRLRVSDGLRDVRATARTDLQPATRGARCDELRVELGGNMTRGRSG